MVQLLVSPIQRFIKAESFSGFLLFSATILALVISNSALDNYYFNLWLIEIGVKSGSFELVKPLILWINDGLMAFFFFLIGLEIKREILIGELNSVRKASLPVFAALGGMIVPLIFYLTLNQNPETESGWGISMATDIAFTLAILKLLGKRVPLGLKIFLTAFAIIDDIGAVLVIAIFYSSHISWTLLLYAGIMLLSLYMLSYFKIHNKFILLFFSIIIWYLFLKAGVHPTLAGILVAFSVPIRQKIDEYEYADKLKDITQRLVLSTNSNKLPVLTDNQIEEIDELEDWTHKVQSPVQQLEHRLHTWVAFLIMPVFALANAGVQISGDMEINRDLAMVIALSLFLGKTIGVSLFSYLSLKLKISDLPGNTSFKQIIGVAILSGVGFTMSLFIGGLAFYNDIVYLNSAKLGIIAGSLISGIIGFLFLRLGKNTADR